MKTIQDAIRDAGYMPRSYSGRGMYGKTCLSVTVSDVLDGVLEIQDYLGKKLPTPSVDNMGRSYVLYWPNTPFVESGEDESEFD